MKKILIIDTTYPINSRTERFKNSFEKYFQVSVVAWNRGIKKKSEYQNKIYVLETDIGYGNQIKKILNLPFFLFYLYFICRKEKPNMLFASHWDSLICAVFVRIFWNWKLKIIYDCLDIPTFSNIFIQKTIIFVEKICLKFVDLTIFASRYFKPLYSNNLRSYVFENYPSINSLGINSKKPNWLNEYYMGVLENKNNVVWIGVVRYLDIIENILLAIKGTNLYFFIFGDGPDLEKLKKSVEQHKLNKQVIFFGRYELSDLRYIYEKSNMVWAAYPTNDYNAIYAISNKYFECSFFEKKIILSSKTKMAESLIDNQSVILVDEYSCDDIRKKLLLNVNISIENYNKYESDTSWEEQEIKLIDFIKASK